jgi:hypothetical protein
MASPFDYDLDLNLDAMAEEDLEACANHLTTMVDYCSHKLLAMRQRKIGRIQDALDNERACELIYQRIPANWRW